MVKKIRLLRIVKSSNSAKKWDAFFMVDDKEKKISFGASNYRDNTLINDKNSKFYLKKLVDRNVSFFISFSNALNCFISGFNSLSIIFLTNLLVVLLVVLDI